MLHKRNKLRHEVLEQRQMLAADSGFSPWTHPIEPADVTGDDAVTARDALVIINQLTHLQTSQLADIEPPLILGLDETNSRALHPDTTGDGLITARDALFVINHLSRHSGQVGVETEQALAVDIAMSQLLDDAEQTATTIDFSQDDGFGGDFGRADDELTMENPTSLFRFVATNPKVSVDLSSTGDEQVARVIVLNADMEEITSSDSQSDRMAFEGIDVTTQAGAEYFIRVEYASSDMQPTFSYALSVYQFEPSRWLPPSSDEVIVVGENSDLPDTIADATDVAIRTTGSSFVQQLETPGDVDVIRLPNGLPGSVFVGGLDGISFELVSESGEVLRQQPSTVQVRSKQAIGYFPAEQVLGSNQDSLFLRVFSTTDATGSYNVSVLFDSAPEFVSDEGIAVGRIVDAFDPSTATTLRFEDGLSSVQGSTHTNSQIDFYVFPETLPPEVYRADIKFSDNTNATMQVFNTTDSTNLTKGSSDTLSVPLTTDDSQQVAVGIHNSRQATQYEFTVELVARPLSPTQISSEVLESAIALPILDTENPDTNAVETINLAAGQTVLYRYTARKPQTWFVALGSNGRDLGLLRLEIAFYDNAGTRLSGTFLQDVSDLQVIMDRIGGQFIVADTDADQSVFLRISNPLDRSISFRSQIA